MPGETSYLLRRPDVDGALSESLAREHWGLDGHAHELGSQQDRNWRIDPSHGDGLLLKVHHPSTTDDEISLQNTVTAHLASAGIRSPRLIPTSSGALTVPIVDGAGDSVTVRAMELVNGAPLSDGAPITGAVAEELGRLAGVTVRALAPIQHPAADRDIQWELRRALPVVEALAPSLPEERRAVCLDAARTAATQLEAIRASLPLQVIHSDINADNVMRDTAGELWLIDLGDVVMSYRVAEIAVLAADVMARTGSLAIVGRAVRGFAAEADLTDDEIDAIWPLIVLRGAVLAVSGWSQIQIDPTNDYARERMDHEWTVLLNAAAVPHEKATSGIRLAVGRNHVRGHSYWPLVDGLAEGAILDLGITSPALDGGRWTDPDIETLLAREALASAPRVIARFGEARLTRVPFDVTSPAAARSRCVDLWLRPGTVVSAPFSGEVRLVDDGLEISDRGVVLRVEGVRTGSSPANVVAGENLGVVAPAQSGLGRLRVSRRILDAPQVGLFGGPDSEYEVDGAGDPSLILGLAPAPDPEWGLRRSRARRDAAMGGASERYYAEPPVIERGWDTRLVDTRGRAYLDMVNNVTAIGHSHPTLADRVSRQLHLLNTNSRFLYDAYAGFTERLLAVAPDNRFDTVLPVNSGSEAVDLALRLAQAATGRRDVVALREGYHGWTMGADSVSTSAFDNPAALQSRPSWVHLVDAPNAYRGPFTGADSGPLYAQQLADMCAELVDQGTPPAAFICEPVLGNAGGVIPPEGYLPAAYEAIRAVGGLAIADEVQVGYGRLGASFWGSTLQGAVPDIITVAKAAGNSFPIGAVITTREIAEALRLEGMFFSSAGGAPASAVAGSAVLDVIHSENLQANAWDVGVHLLQRLVSLQENHALIGTIHGVGLYLGVELVRDRDTREPATSETAEICERLLERGIIMQPTSERQNVLKVKPPMTLTREDADTFVNALDYVLATLTD